jgi:hypothetical protein
VVVDLAGHEVADDEVVALEDLVNRRRLVDPAGDGLVVGDVERVRIKAAVPADDVEGVLGHDVDGAGQPARAVAAVLDVDLDVRTLGQQRLCGTTQIALAEWRVLEVLPVLGQVAFRRADVAVRLDHVRAQRLRARRNPAVGGRAREDDVVTGTDLQGPEDRLDRRRTSLDVDALVAGGIAVVRAGHR